MTDRWWPWVVIGYLAGSVPFALLLGLARGADIRRVGSGNVGATNLGRLLGKPWGVLCFVLDALKGTLPVLGAGWAWGCLGQEPGQVQAWRWLAVATAAVVGHIFPVWLRFRGGKGVATGLGVVMGFWPILTIPGLLVAGVWLVVLRVSRYISLASVLAAGVFPGALAVVTVLSGRPLRDRIPFFVVTGLIAALVVVRHRTNLGRLWSGTEPHLGDPIESDPPCA